MESSLPVTGNTEQTRPENRAFYPALDGFRAVAFLMVFCWHYFYLPWGWAGVNFFFVLSGFLITGILLDTRNEPHRARNFYVRRTLRIFPLYYGVMLLIVLAWPVVHWQLDWRWLVWPAYLGNFVPLLPFHWWPDTWLLAEFKPSGVWHGHHFILALGHFWSLCIEEQFYLLWPWVVFAVRRHSRLFWLCALAPLAGLVLRAVCFYKLPFWMIQQGVIPHVTPLRMDDLMAGGLLAVLMRGAERDVVLRIARFAAPPLLLLALVAVVLQQPRPILWPQYTYAAGTLTFGFLFLQILSGALILNAIQKGTWLFRLFTLRPLRWAGRLSYGAYVFHDIFHVQYIQIADHLVRSKQKTLAATMALAATYLVAWLSFRFFETPFLNLKERWTARP